MYIGDLLRQLFGKVKDEPWYDKDWPLELSVSINNKIPYPNTVFSILVGSDRHKWLVEDSEFELPEELIKYFLSQLRSIYITKED